MGENGNSNGSLGPFNYRFDRFAVNERNRELFSDGTAVPLTPKAFDILLVFLKNPDRLLEKDELMEMVWESRFVEEGNLARNVSTLRKALGGDADDHRYIVTVPGRGYRFVAEVESDVPDIESDSIAAGEIASALIPTASALSTPNRTLLVGAAVIVIVLGVVVWMYFRYGRPTGEADAASIRSVAVLPLKNLSGDPSNDYFSDGVTESLANALSRIDGLKVISPGSAAHLQYTSDPAAFGKQLDVAAVLEGNVRKDGDSVWLAVRLVSTADGKILWADDTNERKMKDIFGAQDEIALGIADKLRIKLSPKTVEEVSRRYTESAEAYQLYLKGRYFWNKRTEASLKKGIEYFQQSISADPNYALAYSGVADSYAMLYSYDLAPFDIAVQNAREAALKAIQIDDKLAEPRCTLAYVETEHDWNWQDAESEFKTGIALNPNYATCHHWYALHLAYRGRFVESLQEIKLARQLDPLSLAINSNMGRILYYGRQYDAAIEQLRTTIELDDSFWGAHYKLAEVYWTNGQERNAIEEYAKSMELWGDAGLAGDVRKAFAESGYAGATRKWLDTILERANQNPVSSYALATRYADLGEADQALIWLEKAADERRSMIVLIKVDPRFDKFRDDPRYQTLLKRIGF